MPFNSIAEVDQYLSKIPKFQSNGAAAANFDLNRFKRFCDFLGNPQRAFESIHVAGTNGKGSTCRILGNVFHRSGFRAGVYISPHILRFNERFRINGTDISDAVLIHFFNEYEPYFAEFKLTYFEISTAIAFWWFAQSKVDLAVIETGLGGRLDATNVVKPMVSVITSISLDHTDILGEDIETIAREKAGIIKAGRPVVLGDVAEEARFEIDKIAEQKGSKVYTTNKCRFIKPGMYELLIEGEMVPIKTNLEVPVQSKNIALAWKAVELVREKYPVSRTQFVDSLRSVDLGAGRFTKLAEKEDWFFDGGHNIEAVKAMKQSVQTIRPVNEAVLVLAMLKDKLKPDVMREFSEFKKIYYYNLNFERAATFDDIKHWLPQAKSFPPDHDQQQLLFKDFESQLVIFAGSFYFYATVRDQVKNFLNP